MLTPKYTATATLTGLTSGSLVFGAPTNSLAVMLAPFFKGDKGDQGIQGIQGIQGDRGIQGIQGIQGDRGPPGANGAGYDFTQASPAAQWTIAHNLGYRPSVSIASVGGVEMVASVTHLSNDVTQLDFNLPVAGTARLN